MEDGGSPYYIGFGVLLLLVVWQLWKIRMKIH